MEPIKYQPLGEQLPHFITAEVAQAENNWITFRIRSNGEEIGEVDTEILSDEEGIITGVGPGEQINNGYLSPASLAIAACMRQDLRDRFERIQLYDIDNQLVAE